MSARLVLLSFATMLVAAVHLSAQPATPSARPGSPPRGAESARAEQPGRAERGRYLVEHVAMCVECHSPRNADGAITPGREYMGGGIPFTPTWRMEWATFAPRNAGLLGYSDDQAMRLLTSGSIGRDGTQLRAPMPRFRMTPEDAAAVIAYMRSR